MNLLKIAKEAIQESEGVNAVAEDAGEQEFRNLMTMYQQRLIDKNAFLGALASMTANKKITRQQFMAYRRRVR